MESRIRVIYGDTDQMGVVYYANYFRYFELSRNEFFRAWGGSYRELEQQGFMLPVVEASCSYKQPARYDDVLLVRPRIAELRRASFTFSYELYREGSAATLLCTGRTQHACITREGRPTRLPDELVRILQASQQQLPPQ